MNKTQIRINTITAVEFNLTKLPSDTGWPQYVLNNTYLLNGENFFGNKFPGFLLINEINNKYKFKIGTRLIIGVISHRFYNVYDKYYVINNLFYNESSLLRLKK